MTKRTDEHVGGHWSKQRNNSDSKQLNSNNSDSNKKPRNALEAIEVDIETIWIRIIRIRNLCTCLRSIGREEVDCNRCSICFHSEECLQPHWHRWMPSASQGRRTEEGAVVAQTVSFCQIGGCSADGRTVPFWHACCFNKIAEMNMAPQKIAPQSSIHGHVSTRQNLIGTNLGSRRCLPAAGCWRVIAEIRWPQLLSFRWTPETRNRHLKTYQYKARSQRSCIQLRILDALTFWKRWFAKWPLKTQFGQNRPKIRDVFVKNYIHPEIFMVPGL